MITLRLTFWDDYKPVDEVVKQCVELKLRLVF